MNNTPRFRCVCGLVMTYGECRTATNPFDAGAMLMGCPQCGEVASFGATFTRLCDIDGCPDPYSIGQKHADGEYRFTCAEHAK